MRELFSKSQSCCQWLSKMLLSFVKLIKSRMLAMVESEIPICHDTCFSVTLVHRPREQFVEMLKKCCDNFGVRKFSKSCKYRQKCCQNCGSGPAPPPRLGYNAGEVLRQLWGRENFQSCKYRQKCCQNCWFGKFQIRKITGRSAAQILFLTHSNL